MCRHWRVQGELAPWRGVTFEMGYDFSDRPLAIEAAMVIEKWKRMQDVRAGLHAVAGQKPKGFEDFGEWDEYVDQRGKIVIGGRRL